MNSFVARQRTRRKMLTLPARWPSTGPPARPTWWLAIRIGVFIVEAGKELSRCPRLRIWQRPVDLIRGLAVMPAGVGFHNTRIDGKTLALDQAGVHAGSNHRLKYMAEEFAVTKPAMPVDRERRMVGHPVIQVAGNASALSFSVREQSSCVCTLSRPALSFQSASNINHIGVRGFIPNRATGRGVRTIAANVSHAIWDRGLACSIFRADRFASE